MPNALGKGPRPLWVVVLAAGLIVGISMGLRQVAGLYMPPVTHDLGIGREPFSTAMAVANLLWGVASIFAGAFADKFGAGRVIVGGLLLMMAGNYAMYAAESGADLMWSGVLLGLGVGGCGLSVMVGVIARATTPEQRTAAIATLGIASGIGNFIAFPYTHILMEALGWQGSLLVIIATLGALIPVVLPLSGKPIAQAALKPQTLREAFNEAFRHPSYWLLNAGFFVCGFHVAFYSVHLPAFVSDHGLPAWVGVAALTAVGLANIVGTYLSGQSAKYVEKRRGLSFIYFSRCFVFLGLLFLPITPTTVIVLSAVLGLLWLSTVPLTSALVGTFFGTTWMSMLFGFVLFSHQVGSFIGIWMAGVLYDTTKSYDAMWWISIALGLFAALIHWPIREEPVERLRAQAA
jgi:predicted MFS family arabinose efflux permease